MSVKEWLRLKKRNDGIEETDTERLLIRALNEAPYADRSEVFRWLFAKTLPPHNCRILVVLAAGTGHTQTLEWLRKQGVGAEDCDDRALLNAAMSGCTDALEWLDSVGAATPKACRQNKSMPLRWAAMKGYTGVLKWLAKKGVATPKDCREEKCYALWQAGLHRHVAVLEWLEEQGAATLEECRMYEDTLFHTALAHACIPMLDWLKRRGVVGQIAELNGRMIENLMRSNNAEVLNWLEGEKLLSLQVCQKFALLPRCARELATKEKIARWLAKRFEKKEFDECNLSRLWIRVWDESALATIVLMRRRKHRLPPELWELVRGLSCGEA